MADVWGFESALIDTNVIWAAYATPDSAIVEEELERHRRAKVVLESGALERLDLYVSTLSLVELFKVPHPPVTMSDIAVVNDALTRNGWTIVDFHGGLAHRARELALEHNIKNAYDCAILATAVEVGVEKLITHDSRDFTLGQTYNGVEAIGIPDPLDPTLFHGSGTP